MVTGMVRQRTLSRADMPHLSRFEPRTLIRGAVVVSGALLLVWLSLSFTATMVAGGALARLFPGWVSAQQLAEEGSRSAIDPSSRQIERARNYASRALAIEPTNVVALRTLAVLSAMEQRTAESTRLFALAEQLSRRDLPTQLALIETRVADGDIPGALVHYNRGLSTSRAAREQLFPILVAASKEKEVREQLGKMLSARPNWWREFADVLLEQGLPESQFDLARALNLDVSRPLDREVVQATIARLVDAKSFLLANRVYQEHVAASDKQSLVRNPGFDRQNLFPPLDWSFLDQPGLSALTDSRDNRTVLSIYADAGRGGDVARQVLLTPAGNYRFEGVFGELPTDQAGWPIISLQCLSGAKRQLAELMPSGSGQKREMTVSIPSDCPAAQLTVSIVGLLDGAAEATIERIDLKTLGN